MAAIVALSMSSAIARLWLKRRSGVVATLRAGSSSQLRLSVLATVPVRITRLSSQPASCVTSATACSSAICTSASAGIGTQAGSSSSSTWSSRT